MMVMIVIHNEEIIQKAIELKIILVLLPANVTHLIWSLDIAVFKPFKSILKKKMERFMIHNAVTTFSKKDSINIASQAWKLGVVDKPANIKSGFRSSGIWPASFASMQKRWRLYHNGGINSNKMEIQPWIKAREVIRMEILSLPPSN